MRESLAFPLLCLLAGAGGALASDTGNEDYEQEVKPILAQRCFACHGALKQESGLRLDALSQIRAGGESGPAIEPGHSDASLLIRRVTADESERMPPEGSPLTGDQIAALRTWIDHGAYGPDEPLPPDPRQHWSFVPPVRADLPSLSGAGPSANSIDVLLGVKHQSMGLNPLQPASKATLLRRVYLDLIGIPPTRDQLHAFLADSTPNAYEQVVDQLLANPQHGVRWARHWMDIWRYSDGFGLGTEVRYSQRHMWRFRDWIIDSLNGDKGYDQMIVEMLAADEIAPSDDKLLAANGFLARHWYLFNRNVWLDNVVDSTSRGLLGLTMNCARCHEHKYDPITQQDYYRLRAFFEPHKVRTEPVPGQADINEDGLPRAYDAELDAPTYLFVRGNELEPDRQTVFKPAVPASLGEELPIQPVSLPLEVYYPALRPFQQRDMLAAMEKKCADALAAMQKANDEVALAERKVAARSIAAPTTADATPDSASTGLSAPSTEPADLEAALAHARLVAESAARNDSGARAERASLIARMEAENAKYADSPPSNLSDLTAAASTAEKAANLAQEEAKVAAAKLKLEDARAAAKRGEKDAANMAVQAEQELAAAEKQLSSLLGQSETATPTYTPLGPIYPQTSSGRRTALARWIADRKNPLTARVAVNHIWTRHFGQPIVASMFDFGLRTPKPLHADILDTLAVDFMDSGWSMKRLHKTIVMSDAYQRASCGGLDDANEKLDADNRYLWRMNPRRMEGEIVRDSLLSLAGKLDTALGGRDEPVANAATGARRTIYYRYAREPIDKVPVIATFDPPNVEECFLRQETIVPQHALCMMNSSMSLAAAADIATSIESELGEAGSGESSDEAFIAAAFEQVLGRAASSEEAAACQKALPRLEVLTVASTQSGAKPRQRARQGLVHVLLNHNDFITIR